MKHFTVPDFWEAYNKLPEEIKKLADKNFEILKQNPNHPSLHLKKVQDYYSVRVGEKYRALGVKIEDGILWFWIGTHSEYDKLIA
jgi:mRNA-degrading endonuclease RelE of RelBE toxin-antitoxin system